MHPYDLNSGQTTTAATSNWTVTWIQPTPTARRSWLRRVLAALRSLA